MYSAKAYLIILFICCVFSHSDVAKATKSKEVVISADVWCPYNCAQDSKYPGYMVEIVIESFKLFGSGEIVKYKILPWERAMLEARKGKIAGIIGAIDSESRGLHMPSQELGLMSAHFFTHQDSKWTFSTIENLKKSNKRIGAIKGYEYDDPILSFFNKNPKRMLFSHGTEALPKLIKILKHNRVDTIIEDQTVFWYKVKQLGINKKTFRPAGISGKSKKLYVSFYNKKYADIVSRGIINLRKSGKLKKILEKYNLNDWKD